MWESVRACVWECVIFHQWICLRIRLLSRGSYQLGINCVVLMEREPLEKNWIFRYRTKTIRPLARHNVTLWLSLSGQWFNWFIIINRHSQITYSHIRNSVNTSSIAWCLPPPNACWKIIYNSIISISSSSSSASSLVSIWNNKDVKHPISNWNELTVLEWTRYVHSLRMEVVSVGLSTFDYLKT